jgi:hypothetical protein
MGVFAAALYLGKAGAVQSKRLEGHPGMEYEPDNLGSLSACTRNILHRQLSPRPSR